MAKNPENPECPFCPENGKVEILFDTGTAYLCEVKGNPLSGCYFIIPRDHITSVLNLPYNWQTHLGLALHQIPWWGRGRDFNLSLNVGRAAGQRVPHLHWWVIPRGEDIGEQAGSETYNLGLATIIANANASSLVS